MSRVVFFDLNNRSVGECQTIANRGWGLSGSIALQGGMQTTITIPESVAIKDWLQPGRMVLIEHATLPPWAGVIDLPWGAALPVTVSLYSQEFLMSLRMPDNPVVLNGSFEKVLAKLIDMANEEEELYLRLGTMGDLPAGQQQLTVKQTSLWTQVNDFGKREGVEYYFRPVHETNEALTVYVDAGKELGVDTGMLLHDGGNANMQIVSATVVGKLVNRIIGIGRQDSAGSRPQTIPYRNDDSVNKYRLRSAVSQFNNLTTLGNLQIATQNELERSKSPRLKLNMAIRDAGLFPFLTPGNRYRVHASEIYLPGGVQGWRGDMRMTQMALDEGSNSVVTTMEAYL